MNASPLCKNCGTPLLTKQTQKKPSQLTQPYYYTAYYYCPNCRKLYHDEKFKVENHPLSPLLPDDAPSTYDVEIWTDGACSHNGTPNAQAAWAFVAGAYEANGLVVGKQTNNTAEAYAMYYALVWAAENNYKTIKLHSDSQISLYNMRKPVHLIKENREIFQKIVDVIEKNNLRITWIKVPGHADDVNNNRADRLANGLVGIK